MFTSIIYFKNIIDLANLLINQARIPIKACGQKISKFIISEKRLIQFLKE